MTEYGGIVILMQHPNFGVGGSTMPWKTSKEHPTKGSGEYKELLGKTHTDTYHVDDEGRRDRPRSEDLKVSGPKYEPSMTDIHPPSPPSDSNKK